MADTDADRARSTLARLYDGRSRHIRAFALALSLAAGGFGLIRYVYSGISLPVAYSTVLSLGIALVFATRRSGRLPSSIKLAPAIACGLVATAAYDGVRFGMTQLGDLNYKPFHAVQRVACSSRLQRVRLLPGLGRVVCSVAGHVPFVQITTMHSGSDRSGR